MRTCVRCTASIEHRHYNAAFCSIKCRKHQDRLGLVIKSHEKYPAGESDAYAQCGICGLRAVDLASHLRGVHGISASADNLDSYKEKYGPIVSENQRQKLSARSAGENNMAYGHGGRLSPYSKKFVAYDGKSEDDKEKIIHALARSAQCTARENNNVSTSYDYYLSRGYSSEEAFEILSNRVFSRRRCIEKYGEELGTTVFQERQEKWQKTLQSKPEEERERIRMLKGSGAKTPGFYNVPEDVDENIQGITYYVHVWNDDIEFWKIGITTKTVLERLRLHKFGFEFEEKILLESDIISCHALEQDILEKYHSDRIRIDLPGFKTYEAFNRDVLAS